jgi:hypothetical protein
MSAATSAGNGVKKPWVIATALTSLITIALAACATFRTDDGVDTWPAWIQAIGSIDAIMSFVVFELWRRDEDARSVEKENSIKRASIGVMIYPEVTRLVDRAAALAAKLAHPNEITPTANTNSYKIGEPEMLAESWRDIHVLGPATAHGLLRFFAHIRNYDRQIESVPKFEPRAMQIAVGEARGTLLTAIREVKDAHRHLSAIDDFSDTIGQRFNSSRDGGGLRQSTSSI